MKKFTILFENDNYLIVNKVANFLSTPDRFREDIPNLYTILKNKYGEVYTVNRLDKETSGIICFAKNKAANLALSNHFEQRKVKKIYHALVQGVPKPENGSIDLPIVENQRKLGTMKIDHKKGKESITNYTVIEKFRNYSLLSLELITGRTHQIRVHLKEIGHPLVVDQVYSQSKALYLSKIKRKFNLGKYDIEKPLIDRCTLHSYQIEFLDTLGEKIITLEAGYPKDFKATLNQLRKNS